MRCSQQNGRGLIIGQRSCEAIPPPLITFSQPLPLPLLKYCCKLVGNVSGIIHYLLDILAIQISFNTLNDFVLILFCCLDFVFLHFLQFGLLVSQCTTCLPELVNDAIFKVLKGA
jgi:hypothetical protein